MCVCVAGWMRGQRWGPNGAAGSYRIWRVVNVKYCAVLQPCVCWFHAMRGYPNKPLECQVTCRRFLCVSLADFHRVTPRSVRRATQCVCVHDHVREGAEIQKKREGQNLLWWHRAPGYLDGLREVLCFFYVCVCACNVKISIILQGKGQLKNKGLARRCSVCFVTPQYSPNPQDPLPSWLTSENVISAENVRIY